MKCCGQARAAASGQPDRTSPPPPSAPASLHARSTAAAALPPSPPGAGSALLRCQAEGPILVRGPRTGRSYRFSATDPVQIVDRQDLEALLGTGLFRRA